LGASDAGSNPASPTYICKNKEIIKFK